MASTPARKPQTSAQICHFHATRVYTFLSWTHGKRGKTGRHVNVLVNCIDSSCLLVETSCPSLGELHIQTLQNEGLEWKISVMLKSIQNTEEKCTLGIIPHSPVDPCAVKMNTSLQKYKSSFIRDVLRSLTQAYLFSLTSTCHGDMTLQPCVNSAEKGRAVGKRHKWTEAHGFMLMLPWLNVLSQC